MAANDRDDGAPRLAPEDFDLGDEDEAIPPDHYSAQYPFVRFQRNHENVELIQRAVSAFLHLQPHAIQTASSNHQISNIFGLPTVTQGNPLAYTRQDYGIRKLPILQMETLASLQSEFQREELRCRKILRVLPTNLRSADYDVQDQHRKHLTFTFQCDSATLQEAQKDFMGSLALLMPANRTCGEFQIRTNANFLDATSILAYVPVIYQAHDTPPPRGYEYPFWPTPQGDLPDIYSTPIQVLLEAFVHKDRFANFDFNSTGFHFKLIFVGKISAFIRETRMLGIPVRPENFQGTDYNVSPLYDLMLDPSRMLPHPNLNYQADIPNLAFNGRQEGELFRKVDAMLRAEHPCFLLIRGGPGTAKTSYTAKTLINLFHVGRTVQEGERLKVLYLTPSNSAANCGYERLCDQATEANSNIIIRRLADDYKITGRAQQYYQEDKRRHQQFCEESEIEDATERENAFTQRADILVVTAGFSQTPQLARRRNHLRFNLLVIDECGQGSETQLLMPFYFTTLRYAILIGDSAQLGPTLLSRQVRQLPFEVTHLFRRIQFSISQGQDADRLMHTLQPQYRMRKRVCDVVNMIGYTRHGLETSPLAGRLTRRPKRNPSFMVFSGDSWHERHSEASSSMRNEREAAFGMLLLQESLKFNDYNWSTGEWGPNAVPLTYAIIALYKAQVDHFQDLVNAQPNLRQHVTVLTVDSAQGRQFDIAIVSAVRASGVIGFASQQSRLVVALSRAACVYVLAHRPTFEEDPNWRIVFEQAQRWKAFLQADTLEQNVQLLVDAIRIIGQNETN